MKETKTVYNIRVNYKSGKTEEFECYNFKHTRNEVSWEGIGYPSPLWFGFENVESIWQVSALEVEVD